MRTHARNPDGSASGAAGYCSRLFCHRPRATTRGSILRSCHRSWSFPVVWMWWWRKWNREFIADALCMEFASVHRCQNALVDLLAYASALACPITIFANERCRLCYWPISERDASSKCASSLGSAALPSHTGAERGGFRCFCSQISLPDIEMSCASLIAVTVIVSPDCKKATAAATTASSDGCSA